MVGLSAGLAPPTFAEIAVVTTEDAEIDFGGMVQLLGFAQHLDDPYKNDDRVYLFMNRARLRLSGHYDRVSFYTEMGLGGEDAVVATTGVSLSLLDFAFNVPLGYGKTTYLKIGQFKVPYGREQLTYEGNLQFADRSINNLGFIVGRDVGVAVVSHPGLFTLIGGVFTGGGRDVPPNHYLPEKLGVPLFAARAGIGNFDEDPFYLSQDAISFRGLVDRQLRGAFFVNALYTKDTLIGHSTVLNVKLADKSLLLDGNWNPYIAEPPLNQGTWWQAGADAAGQVALRAVELTGQAAFDFGKYSNSYGAVQMWGVRAQGAVSYRVFEARCSLRDAGARQQVRLRDRAAHRLGADPGDHHQRHLVHPRAAAQAPGGPPHHHPRSGVHRGQRRQLRRDRSPGPGHRARDGRRSEREHRRPTKRVRG